jgi:hypothetical protein
MKKIAFALLALVFAASSCTDDKIPVPTVLYVGEETTFMLSANGETREIEVITTAPIQLEKSEEVDWCSIELKDNNKLVVTAEPNARLVNRRTGITLAAPDRKLNISIEQSGQPSIAMKVANATASSTYSNNNIDVTYNGDKGNGYFMTTNAGSEQVLTYYLEPNSNVQLVGITYYPRLPGTGATTPSSGAWGKIAVAVAKTTAPEQFETVLSDYDCNKPLKDAVFIELPAAIPNVSAVRITVDAATSQGSYASLREIEFNATALQSGTDKFVLPNQNAMTIAKEGGAVSIGVLSNGNSVDASCDASWCTVNIDGSFVNVSVEANNGDRRTASITVTGEGGSQASVAVLQLGNSSMLEIGEVKASTTAEPDEGKITNMKDGDKTTYWHSDYSTTPSSALLIKPQTIEFELVNVARLSHIRYYPRQTSLDVNGNNTGGNGNIGRIEVSVKSSGGSYQKVMDFHCDEKGQTSEIVLPNPVDNATGVMFTIYSGRGMHASCAEMEFYGASK